VPETAPGTVIKIENANQFAPVGCDPKELRSKFHEVQITANAVSNSKICSVLKCY